MKPATTRTTTAPRFRPVPASARAIDHITNQIRTQLARGRLQVGSKLPAERTLATQFGVSRNTLREALRSLENAGLITFRKGVAGGAFIQDAQTDSIVSGLLDMYHLGSIQPRDLTEARVWIESVVIAAAHERATPDDIAALHDNVRATELAYETGEFTKRAALNVEFHHILARATKNPILVVIMDGVLRVLTEFIRSIGDYDNKFVIPSRRRFLRHFESGDVDAAIAEMQSVLHRLEDNYFARASIKPRKGKPHTVKPSRGSSQDA